MIGNFTIKIYKIDKLIYELNISRNITYLSDISATGKSTLCNIINEINSNSDSYKIESKYECVVINNSNWKLYMESENRVLLIDEDFSFNKAKGFSKVFKNSDNFLFIINRKPMRGLTFSYKEIYRVIKDNRNVNILERKYNFDNDILTNNLDYFNTCLVLTEDSKFEYIMYKNLFQDVKPCNGKYNIINNINKNKKNIIILDGAAFGSEMDIIFNIIKNNIMDCIIYLPESFEYLLLKAYFNYDINIIEIDTKKFNTWENFFEDKLIDYTKINGIEIYNKSKSNIYFINNINRFIKILPDDIKKYCLNYNKINLDWN